MGQLSSKKAVTRRQAPLTGVSDLGIEVGRGAQRQLDHARLLLPANGETEHHNEKGTTCVAACCSLFEFAGQHGEVGVDTARRSAEEAITQQRVKQ